MKKRDLVDGFIIHSFNENYCRQLLCHPEMMYEYSIKKTPDEEPVDWIGESIPVRYIRLLFILVNVSVAPAVFCYSVIW